MTVRFDAYTATMRGPKPDDLAQLLFDQVGLGGQWSKGRGFHQFGERLSAKDYDGHEVGAVSFGGKQGELVMIEVKGERSPAVVEAIRARFPHKVTRVDSCADFDAPGAFQRLYKACRTVKKAHGVMGGKAGDWEDFPEKGRTLYLGSKASPCRARLYEKGLQPEYLHLSRPNWVRLEAQIRPKGKEAGHAFSTLSALDVWGAGRWTRDLAAQVLQEHVEPHPAGTVYRLTDRETALRWMCKQYGQHLTGLAQDLGGWDCLGLTLQEIITEQAKGR
jgi:DNA relaxase NicK